MSLPPIEIANDLFKQGKRVLPPLPKAVTEVLDAVRTGKSSIREITEVIGRDVGFTSLILNVANSSYFAPRTRIADIRTAVVYLGLMEVSRIALTISVVNALKPKDINVLRGFWVHAYLSALVAKHLRAKIIHKPQTADDVHTAALLHRIGVLVYAKFYPKHFEAINAYRKSHGCLETEAEKSLGFPTHCTIGLEVCKQWNLPESLQHTCEFHDLEHLKSLEGSNESDTFDILVTSASLLSILTLESPNEEIRSEIIGETCRVFDISETDCAQILVEIQELKEEAELSIEQLL
jgi:HD-like signal output (HDOD) protein